MNMEKLLKSPAGRVAVTGILAALALILGVLESMLPTVISVPGIKLGLSNIAVVLAVYLLGKGEGFAVMITKVLLSALLYAGINGLIYSAMGGAFSFFVIGILYKRKSFSVVGVSAAAGAAHNIGQIFAAIIVVKSAALLNYLPVLVIAGCISGLLTGIICSLMIEKIFLEKL